MSSWPHGWLLPDWPAPAMIRACVTTRTGGISVPPFDSFNLGDHVGDDPSAVAWNRQHLQDLLGCRPAWLSQVHSSTAIKAMADSCATADASWSDVPGEACAVLTADCLPVLFCADDGSEVAAAHAGWRGLVDGVLEATVAAMRTPPARVLAWMGPAAGPSRYEVGVEVYDAFVSRDWSAGSAFTSTRERHWHVDLYALARGRLQAAGLAPAHIHGGGLCTISDPQRFYSHRRDRRTGRMASLVWMAPRRED